MSAHQHIVETTGDAIRRISFPRKVDPDCLDIRKDVDNLRAACAGSCNAIIFPVASFVEHDSHSGPCRRSGWQHGEICIDGYIAGVDYHDIAGSAMTN